MYLMHHGRKGQKWGVRNGPPYPLDAVVVSRSYGKAKVDKSRVSDIPNTKKLNNYKGPMYFISTSNMDDKTLEPRVVDNYFTRNGYEDSTTKRVSFAPSVNQCLMGLSQDVSNKDFYVYEPSDRSKLDIYKPNPKAVPDSSVTGELWVTTPVQLKRVGKIRCTGDDGKEGKKFNYGTHTAELYGWNFEWKSKSSVTEDTYGKINSIFRKMPLKDRRMIDPDISSKPQDYYDSVESYFSKTAFNSVRGDGFLVAEKIPRSKNVDQTVGVEIGVGVLSKGKGTGTKLANDLTSWFNSQNEFDVMWWPVDDANVGSKRLAEKAGFIKDPLGSDYVYATEEAKRKLGI